MDQNIKLTYQALEELKDLRILAIRAAMQLDHTIQTIENELYKRDSIDPNYLKYFIKSKAAYRDTYKRVIGLAELDEKEKKIFYDLIDNIE